MNSTNTNETRKPLPQIMLNVKIKLLFEDARVPVKAFETDACFDLYVHRVELFEPEIIGGEKYSDRLKVSYGFATEIPVGFKAVLMPRSSFSKYNLILQNSPGQIDADYRGEWYNLFRKANGKKFDIGFIKTILDGDIRLTQFCFERVIPARLVVVDDLQATDRGAGGYGSTGK